MCCRYLFSVHPADIRARELLERMARSHPGEYKTGEIFPGDPAVAVLGEAGRLRLAPAVFGFPGFSGKGLLLNARAETAEEKPAFAEAFRARRAVLPADGFFEWTHDGNKTKYLFVPASGGTLYLCGLWWRTEEGIRFVILTRSANASLAGVHDRMPVTVPGEAVRDYLTDLSAARALARREGPPLEKLPT